MTILVAGATGATGRLVVKQLLERGERVKAVVRYPEKLSEAILAHKNLSVINSEISMMSKSEMAEHLKECDAVVSCLGHNLSFKGVFGPPYKLVTDAVELICAAVKENRPLKPVRFILMNTTGNSNRDIKEPVSLSQKCVMGIIRLLLPPQSDNESAADYLRLKVGQNNREIEWTAVRPDSLIDSNKITEYSLYPSPVRSPVFNPGRTSRINVAHFMSELIAGKELWQKWKGQMPVIYNSDSLKK